MIGNKNSANRAQSDDTFSQRNTSNSPMSMISGSLANGHDEDELSLLQLWTVLQRRIKILTRTSLVSAAAIATIVIIWPSSYVGSFRLLLESVTQERRTGEILSLDKSERMLKPYPVLDIDYVSQIEVLKSGTALGPALARIQQQYPEIELDSLTKNLQVKRPKDTRILDIIYQGKNKAQTQFVLSELSQAFIDYSVTDQQTNRQQRIDFFDQQIQRQKQDLSKLEKSQNISQGSAPSAQIQQDLEIATASLGGLLTERQLELTREVKPWKLISTIDDSVIKPKSNKILLLLLGGLASAIVGISAALLAEQLDHTYHTIAELKAINLPCLGKIPPDPRRSPTSHRQTVGQLLDVQSAESPRSQSPRSQLVQRQHQEFLEAFCSLAANLHLFGDARSPRLLTVSSPTATDGRSLVACHLAWAAMTLGRRVLIVDTDMRHPQVHLWFDLPNQQGLSDAIASGIDAMELIQTFPQHQRLHILTAGSTTLEPVGLLASDRMQQLVAQCSKQYDLVIFDAPPVLDFADAKLISSHTDGLLMVLDLDKTDRTNLDQALDELNVADVNILGLVANGVKG
jgi:capsular exopolysaccharide synthesis family protein